MQLKVIFDSQATNRKEVDAPAIVEASTFHLERARYVACSLTCPQPPRVHKDGTINRKFPILIDIKITENAVFPIKSPKKICL
jgi:hypothetical protein